MSRKKCWRNGLTMFVVACLIMTSTTRTALAYKPQSPEVQALVNRGIKYIEGNFGKHSLDAELGAICICALACYSHTGNPEHPVVKKAVEEIRKELKQGIPQSGHANYSLGIALILLGSVDPAAYSQETNALLKEIANRQMPGGAWSYPGYQTGDTSQTQFACLGMWMAHRQGINVSIPSIERVTNWLIRTQAPDGAFGYQGKDPGGYTRVAQERTTPSMGVAGTGTLYVCGELLGFIEPPPEKPAIGLPTAMKRAPKKKAKAAITAAVDAAKWRDAITAGDNWANRNANTENFIDGVVTQQYYYMYTVERYWAFRELTAPNTSAEPGWYNSGVDYLRKKVDAEGSWTSGNSQAIDTAFAILFLLRSSKKTIQKIVEESGALVGGRNLPDDLTDVKQNRAGKIVSTKEPPLVEDLLSQLEGENSALSSMLDGMPDQLALSSDPAKRAQQIGRLRRLAISGPFEARITAVKTISRNRDLDNAPPLIYALTDPDTRVSRAAANGLRFLSRKFDGPTVPEEATPQQKQAVAAVWKEWYLGVRPDGSIIE